MFEPKLDSTKELVKPENTKVEAFRLSVTNAKTKKVEPMDENMNSFKALAFKHNLYQPKITERFSAPPKIT